MSEEKAWLRRYRPAPPSGSRLVCLPHAGGSASAFLPLARAVDPALDVVAVQYPGRQDRRSEPNVGDLRTLADRIYPVLAGQSDRPLAIFGHSMGAVLAYEVTLRLEAAGKPPVHLFTSGRRAPSRYRDEQVHLRDDQGILAELALLDGTSSELIRDPDVISMIMPALRNDYRAIETYRHEPGRAVACPLTALVGDCDPKTSLDEARDWAGHTTGPFDLRVFPGGHFYLNGQVPAVAALVSGALAGPVGTAADSPTPV
nr:alpha/beta fold hydrolase [Micromonospora sp. ATCC 39149]